MIRGYYYENMKLAQLEIVLRNGAVVIVGFDDDEAVNAEVERLKGALADPNGIFTVELANLSSTPPTSVYHYLPSREIVRFAVTLYQRATTPV